MIAMNYNKIRLSIVIPTYNPGDYIYECLDSINKQTLNFSFFEIVIVLNGEKEPYYSLLTHYLEKCQFQYKLLYSDVKGVSYARNIGIENSKSDYLCFVDDDDILSPKYLECLLDNAEEDIMPICNIKAFVDNLNNQSSKFFLSDYTDSFSVGDVLKPGLRSRSILSVPVAKLFSRKMIGNQRFDCAIHNGEDSLFVTSVTNKIRNLIVCENEAVYFVRLRKGSASRHKIPFRELLFMTIYLFVKYTQLFFSPKPRYPYALLCVRYVGVLKNLFVLMKNAF